MERTRPVATVLAIATAFGTGSAGVGAPSAVHAAAAPAPAAPAPACPEQGAPVVAVWAAGVEGAITAANRAW